jgi:hypothetical protein
VDRIAKVAAGVLALLAIWNLLGAQGARLGAVIIPPLSPFWIVAALAIVFWLTSPRAEPLGRKTVFLAAVLLLAFFALCVWRNRALHPRTPLMVLVDQGTERPLPGLRLAGRHELRRLAGRRRNVTLEAKGLLEVPRSGPYRLEIVCDDGCEILLGSELLRAEGSLGRELSLEAGDLPFELRYRQLAGPAELLVAWDQPAWFEPLPMDYFVRSSGSTRRSRTEAHLALVSIALWWAFFPFFWMRLARAKDRLPASVLPTAAVALLVLYGSLLRFEAFLAHSGLAGRDDRAAEIHEALRPWLPGYGVLNPENAPEDPYRADVRSYLDRAEAMASEGFYAPSFREPFYVLLVFAFVRLAGGPIGILIESTVFSALTLALFAAMVSRLHGRRWAAALLVPVALHEWLVLDAPTGYRESAYSFFLLAFLYAAMASRSGTAAGILAGLLSLIRLSALSIIAPVLAIRGVRLRADERRRYAALFLLLLVCLVGPFLYSNFRSHGDPFYSVSFHTQFWLRAEGLDARQGPVSLGRYFTDFERTGALLKGTFLGLTVLPLRTFWNGLARFPLLAAATLAIGVFGLVRLSSPLLTAAYFGHLVAFAYIQNFPSGEMPRFVMPAFYLLVLAIPLTVRGLFESYWMYPSARSASRSFSDNSPSEISAGALPR